MSGPVLSAPPVEGLGPSLAPAPSARPPTGGPGFSEVLSSALQSVEGYQAAADVEAAKTALGGGNLHELTLSLEKADIAMKTAMKVRNKVVDAYHEIMRMSV